MESKQESVKLMETPHEYQINSLAYNPNGVLIAGGYQ